MYTLRGHCDECGAPFETHAGTDEHCRHCQAALPSPLALFAGASAHQHQLAIECLVRQDWTGAVNILDVLGRDVRAPQRAARYQLLRGRLAADELRDHATARDAFLAARRLDPALASAFFALVDYFMKEAMWSDLDALLRDEIARLAKSAGAFTAQRSAVLWMALAELHRDRLADPETAEACAVRARALGARAG